MSNRTLMRFTGVGGQGVLLAGEIFAAAKISNGGFGLKTATYTSQVRGGDKKRWNIIEIQIITIAKDEVGNVITQSILALAIANYFTGETIPKEVLRSTMLSKIPPKLHELNNKAYDLGYKYAKEADNRK